MMQQQFFTHNYYDYYQLLKDLLSAGFKQIGITLKKKIAVMITYDTVSEAISGLRERGFNLDFNLRENCLVCNNEKFDVNDFEIVEIYRFEGDTDPSDEAVVYALESTKGLKGILVNGYGISADPMSEEMERKLQIHKRD